jgi:hypothetical protein
MGLKFSASKTGLLLNCRYPFRDDIEAPPEEPNEWSERGTRVHVALDGGPPVPPEEQGLVDAARKFEIVRGTTLALPFRREVSLWWVPGTNLRGEGKLDGRTYSGGPDGAVYGTVDIFEESQFERIIWDYKTTERSARKAEAQLMTLAVLSNADGKGAVELRVDGTYQEHLAGPVEPWDLDAHASKLATTLQAISGSSPTPGDHCSDYFCPLRGTCPAYTEIAESAVQLIAPNALVRRKVTDPIVDAEGLGEALSFVEMLGNWVDKKKDEAKAFCDAQGGEVRISPTHVYHAVQTKRSGTSVESLTKLARRLGATDLDIAGCEWEKVTPTYRRQAKAEKKSA